MALAELSFADHGKLKAQGRSFDCATCPARIQTLRRCREDRDDFTAEDSAVFPIYIEKGGTLFGFCPGKATWDHEAVALYRLLIVAAHTGMMLDKGSLSEQTDYWIELLAWFLPFYDNQKFVSRARMILGDSGKQTSPRTK
jgi:hypothetical protein